MPEPFESQPLPLKPFDLERWKSAQQDLLKGRGDRALATYRDLLKRFPHSDKLWFELGLAAAKELEFEQADQAFQRALHLVPGDIPLRLLIGQQYHLLRRMDRARECFAQAAGLDPASVTAQLSLADWYERENNLDAAWDCVAACADRHPEDPQVQCSRALLMQRRGQRDEAEHALRALIARGSGDLNVKFSSRHQLGVVLDEMGEHDEALKWLAEAKTVLRQSANVSKLEQSYDQADRRRRQLLADLTPLMIRQWQSEPAAGPDARRRLAFLGGHPRSGTTLLEQILASHPDIAAYDEPVAFSQEILEPLAPLENAQTLTANGLNSLSASRRQHFRARYLKNLAREQTADAAGQQLIVDKNPSHTAAIHLWLRLFPGVKIIIALRDPRDVVMSCYFQNLKLNAVNANFLSLDRTVKHYCDLMDVWLRLRELGGFHWVESKYEEIVDRLEPEGQRVTEFLGLTWLAQQAVFHESARNKLVVAPNYRAVVQPVYRRALGRWHKYGKALAPHLGRLAPYCRAFGYEAA
jgi:tetratricopeptide (TPR) repeat protein